MMVDFDAHERDYDEYYDQYSEMDQAEYGDAWDSLPEEINEHRNWSAGVRSLPGNGSAFPDF